MKKWTKILCGLILPVMILLSGCGGRADEESILPESSEVTLSSEVSETSESSAPETSSAESSVPESSGEESSEAESSPEPESSAEESKEEESAVSSEPSSEPEPEPSSEPSSEPTPEPEPEPSSEPSSEPEESSEQPAPPAGEKDQYLTDPIPEGKPHPVEPQNTEVDKGTAYSCTLSIRCDTILDNMDDFNMDKISVLPEDGVIFPEKTVTFYEGESVFDVLLREVRAAKIHMEFSETPMYNSNYIEGINNLYEFDCGELSGWMYKVNGWFPNYGCSRYQVQDGDRIEWLYTCDLGRDLGCVWMGGE